MQIYLKAKRMLFKKGTKLYSILNKKCPRCHKGKFFKYSVTFSPSKVIDIYDNCSECNLKYMLEPSFFIGAMYVNYALIVAFSVITFIISTLGFGLNLLQAGASILIGLLIFGPLNLRLSRIIWINMFVEYQKKNKDAS